MANKTMTSKALLMAGALIFAATSGAQEIELKVRTEVGQEKAQLSEHRIKSGTEAAIHAGNMYRIMVTPTVANDGLVQLSFRVLDAVSGNPVFSPSLMVGVGQTASSAMGSAQPDPRNLKIEVTPSL